MFPVPGLHRVRDGPHGHPVPLKELLLHRLLRAVQGAAAAAVPKHRLNNNADEGREHGVLRGRSVLHSGRVLRQLRRRGHCPVLPWSCLVDCFSLIGEPVRVFLREPVLRAQAVRRLLLQPALF